MTEQEWLEQRARNIAAFKAQRDRVRYTECLRGANEDRRNTYARNEYDPKFKKCDVCRIWDMAHPGCGRRDPIKLEQ